MSISIAQTVTARRGFSSSTGIGKCLIRKMGNITAQTGQSGNQEIAAKMPGIVLEQDFESAGDSLDDNNNDPPSNTINMETAATAAANANLDQPDAQFSKIAGMDDADTAATLHFHMELDDTEAYSNKDEDTLGDLVTQSDDSKIDNDDNSDYEGGKTDVTIETFK